MTARTVEAQCLDPHSKLSFYWAMTRSRRSNDGLRAGDFRRLPGTDGVLARGEEFVRVANLSDKPIEPPHGNSVVLASTELSSGLLPPDATAWLRALPANTIEETSHHEAEGGE